MFVDMDEKIKEMIQKRQDANRELLKMLSEYIEKFPEQRFGQILVNYGFIDENNDPFYEESVDTLNKCKSKLKFWEML